MTRGEKSFVAENMWSKLGLFQVDHISGDHSDRQDLKLRKHPLNVKKMANDLITFMEENAKKVTYPTQ